jgi:predicted metal-dependent enzyme (double-stranded beta helix superfamily)
MNRLINMLRTSANTYSIKKTFSLVNTQPLYRYNRLFSEYSEIDNTYTKLLLYNSDGMNISYIRWNPKKCSPIHNHDGHCFFKVVSGFLHERVYSINSDRFDIQCKTYHSPDNIGYIHNDIGYHSIYNPEKIYSYSLHLYMSNSYELNIENI